jgi:glycosyltransferase involved in cell wall biosynthesis
MNFVNNITDASKNQHSFVFYKEASDVADDPLKLLDLDGLKYEVRDIHASGHINKRLPGRLNLLISALNQLIEIRNFRIGDKRIVGDQIEDIDAYVQFDPNKPFPRSRKIKKALFVYDVIPFALEWDYLWSYNTARKRGLSKKAALRVSARRFLYRCKMRSITKCADMLLVDSQCTKDDIIKYSMSRQKKMTIIKLGINQPGGTVKSDKLEADHYVATSWGYIKRPHRFEIGVPFILFVGGADRRRKLEDLVTAFNHIRAVGVKLKLVLVGDSMQGPMNIATEEIQSALRNSSYLSDIVFMGFINNEQRDWLYSHAAAFVFPSRYEGFGLPVLEAMSYGIPVISYNNRATREVARDYPIYAEGALELRDAIMNCLNKGSTDTARNKRISFVKQYAWTKTSEQVIKVLESL